MFKTKGFIDKMLDTSDKYAIAANRRAKRKKDPVPEPRIAHFSGIFPRFDLSGKFLGMFGKGITRIGSFNPAKENRKKFK